MKFAVYGAFSIPIKKVRKEQKRVYYNDEFWKFVKEEFCKSIEEKHQGLSDARGVYVFAIRNGKNFKPWYIGKAIGTSFKGRLFSKDKRKRWLKKFSKSRGKPYVFLIAAKKESDDFVGRRKSSRMIGNLERLMIYMALRKNNDIFNDRIAAGYRNMTVPGVINSKKRRLSQEERDLKNALGILVP